MCGAECESLYAITMRPSHRQDVFSWAIFDEPRNMDFNGWAWIRPEGNVLIDPVPMRAHDLTHLEALGGAAWIVVTNSDHLRDARSLAERFGAQVAGPGAERDAFEAHRWLTDSEQLVPGLVAIELEGSKTPGELALVLDGRDLITGDLVRAPIGGSLTILPDAKLSDRARAVDSIQRLADRADFTSVLVGDGWPVFRDGGARLRELLAKLRA